MHRRMTITVVNTGVEEVWTRSEDDLEHGKWMKNNPPVAIRMNESVEIKSEKQTGAAYGTTGSIEFISNIRPNNTLRIEWNKPYGTDETTCDATVIGDDYTAKVEDIDFQKSYSSCDVVIKTN